MPAAGASGGGADPRMSPHESTAPREALIESFSCDNLVVVTHRPLPEEWLARFPDAPFHTADSVEAGVALAKELRLRVVSCP